MQMLSCREFCAGVVDGRLVDVRSEAEFNQGHIEGAELLPLSLIPVLAAERLTDRAAHLIVCCAAGGRAMLAAKELEKLGYTNVSVLEGGYGAWCEHSS